MSNQQKNDYVITAGKHIASDGKKYVKGDVISLTDNEAKGMVNKIANPADIGISNDTASLNLENAQLKTHVEQQAKKIAELEQEIAELKEAIGEDEDE